MFGPVKLHLSTQRSLESPDITEDTGELSTLIKGRPFLFFPAGLLRGARALIFFHSRYAADMCLGARRPSRDARFIYG